MGTLANLKNAIYNLFQDAPGKSMNVDLQREGGSPDDAELYSIPGIFSKPIDGVTGIVIDVQGLNIVIATHDYRYDKDIDKGEILIYSNDSDGNLKGEIFIDKTGKVAIRNETKSLKTLIDDLIDEVKNIITTGSPTTHTVSAGSKTLLDGVKTDIANLLRD